MHSAENDVALLVFVKNLIALTCVDHLVNCSHRTDQVFLTGPCSWRLNCSGSASRLNGKEKKMNTERTLVRIEIHNIIVAILNADYEFGRKEINRWDQPYSFKPHSQFFFFFPCIFLLFSKDNFMRILKNIEYLNLILIVVKDKSILYYYLFIY